MKLARLALLAAGAGLVVAFAGVGRPDAAHSAADTDRSITVSGTGSVTVVPDRVGFSFGVDTRANTASDALAANGATMRKVIAALEAAGVDEKDIQTQQVSLSPVYTDDGRTVVGYAASNSVSVTVHGVSRAGVIIDRAVAAGANEVGGPFLSAADQAALYRKALAAAVDDTRAKAEALAAAGGLTLGHVTVVSESGAAPVPEARTSAAAAESTPVEAGTQQIQASVTVTFAAS